MKTTDNKPYLIIGAGLTGLALGYYLQRRNKDFIILESRKRIGGRILTNYDKQNNPIELGATWLGKQHKHLLNLLSEIGIEIFEQEFGTKAIVEPISTSPPYLASLPSNDNPSFRIKDGTISIPNKLRDLINPNCIKLNEKVTSISLSENGLRVRSKKGTYLAKKVISTLPPNLLVNTINFTPQLPKSVNTISSKTHTWMSQSIKVALSFDSPFWRKINKPSTVMSNVGPIPEMYEHNNYKDNCYALMGFMNGNYYSTNKEHRLSKIIHQLTKYYGEDVQKFSEYHEKIWATDEHTHYPYDDHVLPHENNGHVVYQQSYLNERFIISGTETSLINPGYLDGALNSAIQTLKRLDLASS